MSTLATPHLAATAGDLRISRTFNAPRERVFQAWADPAQLVRWCAPHGCTLEFQRFDFRPGGGFRHALRNPQIKDCLCSAVYREIVPPERIVFDIFFSDEHGNLVEPASVGADAEWPRELTVTLSFVEEAGKTRMTLHQSVPELVAKRTGAYQSWEQMFDRLADLLVEKSSAAPNA
jgi:uncharacterized protein YndB with AHSA1/START domain